MIEYTDEGIFMKLPYEAVDEITIAMLKEGRDLVLDSIANTLCLIIDAGEAGAHHVEDLIDNSKYLEAFDTLLEYYGGE